MEYIEPQAPPPLPKPPLPETPASQILYHSSIHQTIDGKTFGVMLFRDFFDCRKVKGFLQAQTPQLPDFLVCLWANHSLNFRIFHNESVNLAGLLQCQGMESPPQMGLIYPPRWKLYQAGPIALYRYRPIDELIDLISNSRLTGNLVDLYLEVIIEVAKVEKISPKDSFWVRVDGPVEIHIPFDEKEDTRKQIIREKEYTIIFQHSEVLRLPSSEITPSSPSVPAPILYIDTIKNTLNFNHLLTFSAPLGTLKNIIFTQITDFSHLESFIQEYLRDLLQKAQIELIVLNLPFDLIDDHCDRTSDPEFFYHNQAKLGVHFIEDLKIVAMHANIPIFLTSLGTSFDRASARTSPTIPDRVKSIIRHKIFLNQPRTNFQLEVRRINELQESIEHYIILNPPEKTQKKKILSGFQ